MKITFKQLYPFLIQYFLTFEWIGLSSGKKATAGMEHDLIHAYEKGKIAMEDFKTNYQETELDDTMKVKGNGKEVIMKADNELLGRIALISKDRLIDPKEIFSYPLGSIP